MHILVTRPEPDALKLKGLIDERGHSAAVEPLMHVAYRPFDPALLEGVTVVIATSRNALRALRGSPALAKMRGLRLYAVGAATIPFTTSFQDDASMRGTTSAVSMR